MKIERVSYQKIFPTGMAYLNHKIGVEISVGPDEDENEAFRVAKRIVESWNLESNPGYATALEYSSTASNLLPRPTSEQQRIEALIQDINACDIIDGINPFSIQVGLVAYQEMVKGNPVLQAAYDLKLLQLTNQSK